VVPFGRKQLHSIYKTVIFYWHVTRFVILAIQNTFEKRISTSNSANALAYYTNNSNMVFCSGDTNMVIEEYGNSLMNQRNNSILSCTRKGSVNCVHNAEEDILNTPGYLIQTPDYAIEYRYLSTLSFNQVVIPGSSLQLSISQKVNGIVRENSSLLGNIEDECILCFDTFHNRPKVSTICRCGENRLSIHRECLCEWRTKTHCCPHCNSPLFCKELDL
jgi:hypothetical protein